jgi:hypothetical protein
MRETYLERRRQEIAELRGERRPPTAEPPLEAVPGTP